MKLAHTPTLGKFRKQNSTKGTPWPDSCPLTQYFVTFCFGRIGRCENNFDRSSSAQLHEGIVYISAWCRNQNLQNKCFKTALTIKLYMLLHLDHMVKNCRVDSSPTNPSGHFSTPTHSHIALRPSVNPTHLLLLLFLPSPEIQHGDSRSAESVGARSRNLSPEQPPPPPFRGAPPPRASCPPPKAVNHITRPFSGKGERTAVTSA